MDSIAQYGLALSESRLKVHGNCTLSEKKSTDGVLFVSIFAGRAISGWQVRLKFRSTKLHATRNTVTTGSKKILQVMKSSATTGEKWSLLLRSPLEATDDAPPQKKRARMDGE